MLRGYDLKVFQEILSIYYATKRKSSESDEELNRNEKLFRFI